MLDKRGGALGGGGCGMARLDGLLAGIGWEAWVRDRVGGGCGKRGGGCESGTGSVKGPMGMGGVGEGRRG